MVAVRYMQETENRHHPVMLTEAILGLHIQPDGLYIDATFGRGGHSAAILSQLGPMGKLLAIDRDPEAVAAGSDYFSDDPRFLIRQGSYADLGHFLQVLHLPTQVNGILFDLGVSSPQLETPMRGFSFMREGVLDMRMDNTQGMDAAAWLNAVSEEDLSTVLWRYGEERFSRRIARAIVNARKETSFQTTTELARCVAAAVPKWPQGKHPATRTFQAIRIAVNAELEHLERGLRAAVDHLAIAGRLVVISFHSLEDRIVKQFMRFEERGETLPRGLPVKDSAVKRSFRCLGRACKPTPAEIASNPRSRSAVLRIGEKRL